MELEDVATEVVVVEDEDDGKEEDEPLDSLEPEFVSLVDGRLLSL